MARLSPRDAGGRNVVAVPVHIYSLSDPRTGELRYIGKTVKPLAYRLQNHVAAARRHEKRHVCTWMATLAASGARPEIRLVETVAPGGDWMAREVHWIAEMRRQGARLTNHSAGGEGFSGHKHTDETKRRIGAAHRGKATSAATRALISAANIGRTHSSETRAKVSAAGLGRKVSPSTIERIRASKRGVSCSVGEANPRAILTSADAAEIRSGKFKEADAMARFGIGRTQFYRVKRGEQWRENGNSIAP